MTSAYMHYPTGLDFCPLLEGLERDHCQCPHWGYVIEGRIRVRYEDGSEEAVSAGELYYWPEGHTVVVEEAVRMVEFSHTTRCPTFSPTSSESSDRERRPTSRGHLHEVHRPLILRRDASRGETFDPGTPRSWSSRCRCERFNGC